MNPVFSTRAELAAALAAMKRQRILVVGDVMLDRFVRGKVSRISPEAPVPVVHVTQETAHAGGAANVARNLAGIGVRCTICGLVGRDVAGREIAALLKADGIGTAGLLVEPSIPTIVKTRIFARQQQLVRVDWEERTVLSAGHRQRLHAYLLRAVQSHDAVIIEDYGKGFVTQELVREIFRICQAAGKPVTVDPNVNNPLDYSGATVLKPNRLEAAAAAGRSFETLAEARSSGPVLLRRWKLPHLLVTLGEEGMLLFSKGLPPYHTPTRAREVFDVSGAGDTVIAFFTAALAAGLDVRLAAETANHAAGVVVSKLGTATVTPEELGASFFPEAE
ncbi:MAG: D-glycero-beta-D-manno-heptose-7-phosphate kinase [Candidatus Methylacidiphilales bacterium]|nr:D-glycero-beta-D-manno-heptose-7-phosphate kinase [Candidatus Methylacidiphilales bacterium]